MRHWDQWKKTAGIGQSKVSPKKIEQKLKKTLGRNLACVFAAQMNSDNLAMSGLSASQVMSYSCANAPRNYPTPPPPGSGGENSQIQGRGGETTQEPKKKHEIKKRIEKKRKKTHKKNTQHSRT